MLWEQLAAQLNSCANGATKITDKWIKSWRDWRTETKSKASKLKNYRCGTGGGGPSPVSLNEIEERLISLMGIEAVNGHTNIMDPAEPENWTDPPEPVISQSHHLLPPVKSTTLEFALTGSHLSNLTQSPMANTSPSFYTQASNHPSSKRNTVLTTEPLMDIPSTSTSFYTHTSSFSTEKSTLLTTQSPLDIPSTSISLNAHTSSQLSTEKSTVPINKSPTDIPSISTSDRIHSLSQFSHSPNTKEHETVVSSISCSTLPKNNQYKAKRLKRQRLAEVHDIDVEILKQMRAQTVALEKLSSAVKDIAAYMKHFVNTLVNESSHVNENGEEMQYEENYEDICENND